MKPGQKLLFLAHPRSGSSNLCAILDMHPALEICDEPFNPTRVGWDPPGKNYRELVHDWASLETVLDEIFTEFNGLKLLGYQLPQEWVVRLIERPDFLVLYLRRRNLLQATVSGFIAEQTGLWHHWDADRAIASYYTELEPLDAADVRTRVRELADDLERLELAIQRQPDGRTHTLFYEEFFFAEPAEQARALRAVWSFVGVDPITSDTFDYFLRPEQSKLNSATSYRLLPNAEEIERECGSDTTGHLF